MRTIELLHAIALANPMLERSIRFAFLFLVCVRDRFQPGTTRTEVFEDLTVRADSVQMVAVSFCFPDEIASKRSNGGLCPAMLCECVLCLSNLSGCGRLALGEGHSLSVREDALRNVVHRLAAL